MDLSFFHPKCNKHNPTTISHEEKYIVKYSPPNSPIQKKIIPKLTGTRPDQDGTDGVEANSLRLNQIKNKTTGGMSQQ